MSNSSAGYDIAVIRSCIERAWEDVWHICLGNPEITLYRETQLHIEFAHRLLSHMEASSCRPWHNVRVIFDTPHLNPCNGAVRWEVLASGRDEGRPDIHILPMRGDPLERDAPRILIEIKALANVRRTRKGQLKQNNNAKTKGIVKAERKRLQNLVNGWGWTESIGVLLVAYYRDTKLGSRDPSYKRVNWTQDELVSPELSLFRLLEVVRHQTIPGNDD